jgi:hypothetical protein
MAAHGLQGVHLHHLRPAVQVEAFSRSVHTQSPSKWQEGSAIHFWPRVANRLVIYFHDTIHGYLSRTRYLCCDGYYFRYPLLLQSLVQFDFSGLVSDFGSDFFVQCG